MRTRLRSQFPATMEINRISAYSQVSTVIFTAIMLAHSMT